MKGFNFNISSLFSGMNSGGLFGSFNVNDYTSIKNGSYGKLVKSYYAEQKKTASVDKTTTDKPTDVKADKIKTADKTGASQTKKEADSLKSAADALRAEDLWKQTNGSFDTDKITDAVKSFVKEYNDTLTQSGKMKSNDVAKDVRSMSSMTNTMSKVLSKVGINTGADGKLSFDEDAFKKANVSTVKALFAGDASYGAQISDKAAKISKDAVMSSSMYGSNAMLTNSLSGLFDKMV